MVSLVCPGFYRGIKGVHHCVQPFYVLIMCVCEFLCQDSACVGQKVLDPPETGVNRQSWAPQCARNRTDKCTLNCSAIAPAPPPIWFLNYKFIVASSLSLGWYRLPYSSLKFLEVEDYVFDFKSSRMYAFDALNVCCVPPVCVPQIFIWWTCLFFLN